MIGQKIRSRLERNDANASDLARYCGVSPQAAAQWLNDVAEPRRKYKARIAEFFNITVQELEYGAVLSLTPLPRSKIKVSARASKVSDQVADLMIGTELEAIQKSQEYRRGMRDRIIARLSESEIKAPFQIGTCQADAYMAGCEHGQRLIDKIEAP